MMSRNKKSQTSMKNLKLIFESKLHFTSLYFSRIYLSLSYLLFNSQKTQKIIYLYFQFQPSFFHRDKLQHAKITAYQNTSFENIKSRLSALKVFPDFISLYLDWASMTILAVRIWVRRKTVQRCFPFLASLHEQGSRKSITGLNSAPRRTPMCKPNFSSLTT